MPGRPIWPVISDSAIRQRAQASRLTAIAVIRGRRAAARKAAVPDIQPRRDLPQFGVRIMRHFARRLIGEEELSDHFSRRLGAIGLRAYLHARRRHPDAACGKHPLAFDLDHIRRGSCRRAGSQAFGK